MFIESGDAITVLVVYDLVHCQQGITPLKVLVCDDEKNIVRLIQVNLERMGHQVVTAYDGRDALDKVASEQPDLILLDVMMPYIDGIEVLKSIRRDPETAKIPVIMLTVKAQQGDDLKGLAAGANMYMTKPFNPEDLQAFLEEGGIQAE